MNKEIICGDFEDFVSKLYEAIEKAAKENTGIQCALSPADCKKWADEHVSWICYRSIISMKIDFQETLCVKCGKKFTFTHQDNNKLYDRPLLCQGCALKWYRQIMKGKMDIK